MSIRSVVDIFSHPLNPNYVVLGLDDGLPVVVSLEESLAIDMYSMVCVTGPMSDMDGITSYGDCVQPLMSRPELFCSEPRDLPCTLTSVFSGHQFEAFGSELSEGEVMPDGECVDATCADPGDDGIWVTFAGTKRGYQCFDIDGDEIFPKPGDYRLWSRFLPLGEYYAFAGVMHCPTEGDCRRTFELHFVWNRVVREHVGPPTDRAIAQLLGLTFAESVPVPLVPLPEPRILVRVDKHLPILM